MNKKIVLAPVALLLCVFAITSEAESTSASQTSTSTLKTSVFTLPKVTKEDIAKLNVQNRENQEKDTAAPQDAYPDPSAVGKTDRKTYVALRANRGTTTLIPETDVIKYCSDKSGCEVRIGMHNWDDTGRVASRTFWFFYNKNTGVWRAGDAGAPLAGTWDSAGTNGNNIIEHINNSWSCYFTDGTYNNWVGVGDSDKNFGLLSWNEYNADCFLTLVN
jgi:hypothetical protein